MALLKKYSIIFVLLSLCIAVFLLETFESQETVASKNNVALVPHKNTYRIGIVEEGHSQSQERVVEGVKALLDAKGYGERVTYDIIMGDGVMEDLETEVRRLVKRKPDLLISVGTDATKTSFQVTKTIPIVGIGVYQFQNEKAWEEAYNVTGIADMPAILNQLRIATKIIPIEKLGILYNTRDEEAVDQLQELRDVVAKKNIQLYEVAWNDKESVEYQAKKFQGHVDAVYVPYDEKVMADFSVMANTLQERHIPIISESVDLVREGAWLSVSAEYYRMGYSGGRIVYELLQGEKKPYEIPVEVQRDPDMVINMRVMKKMKKDLPYDIWQRARKLYLYDGLPARP